jgi:chromosome partitioning protein
MHTSAAAAFLNHKGGVGKTTSVINIGAGLAILGNRVLLVDLDPQGHLTRFLGIERDEVRTTIYDVMRGNVPPQQSIITRELRARVHMDGQDNALSIAVIPATLEFADAEAVLSRVNRCQFLLKNAIAEVRDQYDYVLFDCPPSLGLISTNALVAAQTVFVPVQTEYLALHSLEDLLTKVESVTEHLNPDLEVGGLIATRFDGRKVLSRTIVQTMRERFGALLLDTMIRDNIVLAESPQYGKDVFSYRPRSFGAEDYLRLAEEIMDRMANGTATEPSDMDALESYAGDDV